MNAKFRPQNSNRCWSCSAIFVHCIGLKLGLPFTPLYRWGNSYILYRYSECDNKLHMYNTNIYYIHVCINIARWCGVLCPPASALQWQNLLTHCCGHCCHCSSQNRNHNFVYYEKMTRVTCANWDLYRRARRVWDICFRISKSI